MESDTRILLHVAATTVAGHRRAIERTSDVIVGISIFVALGQQIVDSGFRLECVSVTGSFQYRTLQENLDHLRH